jgi:predicted Ser/Thr protein kinase
VATCRTDVTAKSAIFAARLVKSEARMVATPGQDDGPQVEWASRYELGVVLDRKYRLDELLGEGGMGSVWRARNLALDTDVAVKLMHADPTDRESSARFEREAHAAARLDHPYAVRVFDLGHTELGDAFIVMELLRGENLREMFERRKTFSAAEIVTLLLPIASALAAAHDKGIVHRDLKPENIVLVGQDGAIVPKVIDFGIAKIDTQRTGHRTENGSILGSPEYMSPEQASGDLDKVDARTDVWAFAVVLHEAIAGEPPFTAANSLAILREVIEKAPPPLPEGTDPDLVALLERAMTKDVTARYPDMRAFGRALAGWAMKRSIFVDASGGSIATIWLGESRTVDDVMDAAKITYGNGLVRPTTPARGPGRGVAIALGVVALGLGAGLLRGRLSSEAAGPDPVDLVAPPTPAAKSAAPTSSSVASASPSSSAADAAAVTSSAAPSAAAAPVADPESCLTSLWPHGSFEANAPLVSLCDEPDPRRGAALIRGELARRGLLQRRTTDAMQTWSLLSWYELSTVAVMRHACCPAEKPVGRNVHTELPQSIGACPALGPVLDELGAGARDGAPPPAALGKFRDAVACEVRGQRANGGGAGIFGYDGPPSSGGESAFMRWLSRPRTP